MKYNKIGSIPYTHMTSVPYTHMTSVSFPTRNKRKQAIALLPTLSGKHRHDMPFHQSIRKSL